MIQSLHCIAPGDIQDGDLLAYLEGDASPAVIDHIARCPAHQAELAALRSLDALAAGAQFRTACPAPEDLLQYQARLLPDPQRQSIKQHLSTCAYCQKDLAELIAAFGPPATPASSWKQRMAQASKQIVSAFFVPAAATQPVMAVRGVETRQLEYRTSDYQILLSLVPPAASSDTWQLEGQVLKNGMPVIGAENDQVHLVINDQPVTQDVVDDFGFFALDDVSFGCYELYIELETAAIVIEDIDVA